MARTPERRRILCTTCDLPMDIAGEAKSVNCPHCHNRVITEAMDVTSYVAVRRFATANAMHIRKKGRVVASVRADALQVDGNLQGEALALHGIRLTKTAIVAANLRASTLTIDPGATLVGHVEIGPHAVPEVHNLWASEEPTGASELADGS